MEINTRTFGLLSCSSPEDTGDFIRLPLIYSGGDPFSTVREHLGTPFLAGIPNRDILVCFRNDPETLDRLARQIKEDFKGMPHQVTDQVFLITSDGIAVFKG
jgi:hypothetical protein